MTLFMNGVWGGIGLAGMYGLVALGFGIFYAATEILNIAYGSVVMISAYLAIEFVGPSGNPLLATLVSIGAGIVASLSMYLLFILPNTKRLKDLMVVMTFGIASVAEGAALVLWGTNALFLPIFVPAEYPLFGGYISAQAILAIAVAAAASAGLFLLLQKTYFGKAIRAVADDNFGSACVGINRRRVLIAVVSISGALAGLGAAFTVSVGGVVPSSGDDFLLIAISAAVIGGLGNAWGTFVGGVCLGMVSGIVNAVAPNWFGVAQAAIIIAVLVFRPEGLLPHHAKRSI